MKSGGQNQLEANRRTTILSSRTTTNIGTWNVRTMFQTGKTSEVAAEMQKYQLDILGISESRWTGSGQIKLNTGELLLYSGHEEEDAPHSQGVALMLSRKAQNALIGWEAHGSRIITARFKTKKQKVKVDILQVYAPTNDSKEEDKEVFYCRLRSIVQKCPRSNIILLMGDLNAKIGSKNKGYEECMGTQGLGEMNENGERLADLCALEGLVIGGSLFMHKNIHKATWISPDMSTANQIDHICICKKFRRSLQDVRVKRGADVASDHHLLTAKIKLKLKKNWTNGGNKRQRFNTNLLENESKLKEFQITISNKFQVLQDLGEEATIDQNWKDIKEIFTTTCEEVLGPWQQTHKEWISAETMEKIQYRKKKKEILNNSRTRTEKAKAVAEYTEANKEVKRSIKLDKNNYLEGLASEAEEAAYHGNTRELYSTIHKLSGKFIKPERPVKTKDGKSIPDKEGQEKRWIEHFQELLNRPAPQHTFNIEPAEQDLEIDCNTPTKQEIQRAIKQLKKGKAAGPDRIPSEALKADTTTSTEMLHKLFKKIWEEEQIPLEWKEGHLIKLPKKGDLSSCSNYRGITLLSIPSKVFSRVLLNRMREAIDTQLRDQQAGFRKDRSCTDQIATLRIIVEQSLEWNSSLYINFIDYEKAFDSVDRDTLWKLLRHYGVPQKLTDIIKASYEGLSCRIVHGQQTTEAFGVQTGVRQGCLLSPFLFLLAIDWIMKMSTEQKRNGIQWTLWKQLDDLDFADDLALLSHTQQQMQEKTSSVAHYSACIGLNIHREKSKVLKVNTSSTSPITLEGAILEEVESFTYLGSIINIQGGTDADIKARIGKARVAFNQLKKIWSCSNLTLKTKVRLFNTTVKPVLMYGAETWRTTAAGLKKLQTFINSCLRKILRIRWPNIITNEELWRRTQQEPIEELICQRRWKWIGHTLRKPASSITRQSLTWNPQGKRKRGRPRITWRRELEADTKKSGHNWGQLERLAKDRDAWRDFVCGLCLRRDDRR
ncbi:uncharacterized protein [Paramisgurnus dabryanus]|uniref:uncharacterized protein n=1 Tax=Paramisgurnus dabryanus TaxID=90735 RepID=UPI003CCF305E